MMTEAVEDLESPDQSRRSPHRVRMPAFIADEEDVGLGDVIKRATSYMGMQPCGSCNGRAAALNRWLIFTNRQPK